MSEELKGKTAKQIAELVRDKVVTAQQAAEFISGRVNAGYADFASGTGRKPRYASVKLLADLTGKTYEQLRDELLARHNLPPVGADKPKPAETTTTANHSALDGLAVTYVESDVIKLMESKTVKAMITRAKNGQIKDPQKLANLSECERRLAGIPETPKPAADPRIEALEAGQAALQATLQAILAKLG